MLALKLGGQRSGSRILQGFLSSGIIGRGSSDCGSIELVFGVMEMKPQKPQIPAETRNVVVALANVSADLNQIIESLPPAVGSETLTRLRDMAEHLNDLSELLEQQVGRDV